MIFTFGVLVISLLILKSECYPYHSDLVSSKRQCSCDHKSVASFRGGSDRRTSVASVQNIASNRRACHFYLWNAQSALLSRWCNHLQKDNIYEGRGGKKFVRIQPGSMLQLLYPCNQYSPDKCLFCGGAFRDHLTLWWAKNLYTPYDLYLDRIYKGGKVNSTMENGGNVKVKATKAYSLSKAPADVEFCYHRHYVLDVTHLLHGVQRQSDKKRIVQREILQRYRRTFGSKTMNRVEQRLYVPVGKQTPVEYIVPRTYLDNDFLRMNGSIKVFIWLFARDLCLSAVNRLLDLEAIDQKRSQS